MTHRYIIGADRPEIAQKKLTRASYYDGGIGLIHMPDSVTVMVEDKTPEFTGLCDANGHSLYRVPDSVKIGFHTR